MTICDRVPKLNKCCCCIPLRLGGIILAVFYLVGSTVTVSGAIYEIIRIDKNNENYGLELTGQILALATYAIQWILGLYLLLGILTNRHHWLLPYLWLQAFLLILLFATSIFAFFFFWGGAIGLLISNFIALYFWMCIQSLYQELKGNAPRPVPSADFSS